MLCVPRSTEDVQQLGKWAHLPRLAGEIVHTCVYGFASSGEWIRNNLRNPSSFVEKIRLFAFSQLLGKAFSALLPNSLTRYARKVRIAKTTVPPQMGECCHTVRQHTAIEKGLGCSPTSPCKARGFVHTKTLLAGARPSARAHDFP